MLTSWTLYNENNTLFYYRQYNKKTVSYIYSHYNQYTAKIKLDEYLEVYEVKTFQSLFLAGIWCDISLINLGYKIADPFIITK